MATGYKKGVSFGGIHSFNHLGLILSEVDLSPPVPKTYYIDIPGRNGSLDMTDALGGVTYNDRTLKFTFTMMLENAMDWRNRLEMISGALNGVKCNIVLDGDESHYYTGRCTVEGCTGSKKIRKVVVSARVEPYKYNQDERQFIVRLYETERTVTIDNNGAAVVPTVETTADGATIVFNGNTIYIESAGTHIIPEIQLASGTNTMTVSGSGQLILTWREGAL